MKALWIILIIIGTVLIIFLGIGFYPGIFGGGCTVEARICPDGTGWGREGLKCEFPECPEIQVCAKHNDCNEGYECVKFPLHDNPNCFIGPPLTMCLQCGAEGCDVINSDPKELVCK